MFYQNHSMVTMRCQEITEVEMTLTQKRMIVLAIVLIVGIVLGRLAVRAVMNLMLGGTMFGGNFL